MLRNNITGGQRLLDFHIDSQATMTETGIEARVELETSETEAHPEIDPSRRGQLIISKINKVTRSGK